MILKTFDLKSFWIKNNNALLQDIQILISIYSFLIFIFQFQKYNRILDKMNGKLYLLLRVIFVKISTSNFSLNWVANALCFSFADWKTQIYNIELFFITKIIWERFKNNIKDLAFHQIHIIKSKKIRMIFWTH